MQNQNYDSVECKNQDDDSIRTVCKKHDFLCAHSTVCKRHEYDSNVWKSRLRVAMCGKVGLG